MRTLLKDLFREIKISKNRFFSILAITMLGVCFFVGLRVIGVDMEYTANKYFVDNNLNDINLVSSYGFNDKDIKTVENDKNTKESMPSYSSDLLLKKGKLKFVAKSYSINKQSTLLKYNIIKGRKVENKNECIISDVYLTRNNLNIGDKLNVIDYDGVKLREKNLTIVGTASWAYYITDSDYGSSTLGNGDVHTFLILDEKAYDSKVYSNIFLTLKNVEGLNCFSEEYTKKIDKYKSTIIKDTKGRREKRLLEEKQSAKTEIAKARKKIKQEEAQGKNKLLEAKAKLDRSKEKLELNKRKISDNEKTFASEVRKSKAQIKDSKVKLSTGYDRLKKGQDDLKKGYDSYNKEKQRFDSYVSSLNNEEKEKNKQYIEDTYKNLSSIKLKLDATKSSLDNTKKTLDLNKSTLEKNSLLLNNKIKETNEKFDNANKKISKASEQLKAGYLLYEKNQKQFYEEIDKAKDKINKNEKRINSLKEIKWYALDRNNNDSFFSYEQNSAKITSVAKVFPLIFFLVAALVCLTTMTRMVEENRTQLGILKSLGFSKSAVSIKFILYAFLASFLGSLIGMIIGFTFIPKMIYNAYRILYKTPPLITIIQWKYVFMSMFIGVFSTVISAYIACRSSLREVCASLMRPKVIESGRKSIFERIPVLWNKFSFKWKITIRNLVRYKKRLIMSVVGIGACCGLLIAALGLRYSISSIVDLQYNNVWNYNMETSISPDLTSSKRIDAINTIKNNQYVVDSKSFVRDNYKVNKSSKEYTFYLLCPLEKSSVNNYINLTDYNNEHKKYSLQAKGVLISSRLSEILSVKKNDYITIKDMDDKEYKVKINGIVNNYVYHYVFISKEYYKELTGENASPNYILSRLNNNTEKGYDKISEDILENKNITSVGFNKRIADNFANELDSLDFVIVVIIICAGLLAFVVMFNLDNINVSERTREIATIKVLGFYPKEVNFYILRENIILNIIGIIVGCISGKYFHGYLMNTVAVDFVQFYNSIKLSSYIYGILLTIAFAFIVNLFLRKSLKKIDMIKSLKSIE